MTKKSKTLNISLWVAQSILAAMFIMAGIMKSTSPIDQLAPMLPWTKDVPELLVRIIGVSELLAGLGLLVPSIFRIKPILTPVAASGILVIMLLALVFHITRSEFAALGINVFIASMAVFIAWGRFKKVPIQPKKN